MRADFVGMYARARHGILYARREEETMTEDYDWGDPYVPLVLARSMRAFVCEKPKGYRYLRK
jgi:hypothetical protein